MKWDELGELFTNPDGAARIGALASRVLRTPVINTIFRRTMQGQAAAR